MTVYFPEADGGWRKMREIIRPADHLLLSKPFRDAPPANANFLPSDIDKQLNLKKQ